MSLSATALGYDQFPRCQEAVPLTGNALLVRELRGIENEMWSFWKLAT